MTDFFFVFDNQKYSDNIRIHSLSLANGFLHELQMRSNCEIERLSFECDRGDVSFQIRGNTLLLDLTKLQGLCYFSFIVTNEKGEKRTFDIVSFSLDGVDAPFGTYENIRKPKQKIVLLPNQKGTILLNQWFPWVRKLEISSYAIDPFSLDLRMDIPSVMDEEQKTYYFPKFTYDPIHKEIKGKILVETYGEDVTENMTLLEDRDHSSVIFRRCKES